MSNNNQFYHAVGDVYPQLDTYLCNIVGNPTVPIAEHSSIVSLISGVYRYIFVSDTEIECVPMAHQRFGHPYMWSGRRTVVPDGVTINYTMIDGMEIVFRSTARAGDIFEVVINGYKTAGKINVCPMDYGLVRSRRQNLFMINPAMHTDIGLVCTNAITFKNTSGRPILYVWQSGPLNPQADTDSSGATVTFSDLTHDDDGFSRVIMYINGETQDLIDGVDTSYPAGSKIRLGNDYYWLTSSKYQSGGFYLADNLNVTDTATIHVSDGGDYISLLADIERMDNFIERTGLVLSGINTEPITVDESGNLSNPEIVDFLLKNYFAKNQGIPGNLGLSFQRYGNVAQQ